jgi:Skp family chaperone for outer membrane proteins
MKYEQRHEDRLNMIQTIHQNWKDTIGQNSSATKVFLDTSTKIRQEATAACKIAVDQFKAGTLTRDEALTQCQELKKKMQDTIKTMRKELQAARKAAREATKSTNQDMRKTLKEEHKSEVKEFKKEQLESKKKEEELKKEEYKKEEYIKEDQAHH